MDIRQYESQYENRKEEKHHADSRFPYNIYLCSIPQDFRVVPIHWHEEMELISVKKGSGQVILDLQPFPVKTGDLVIVFPGKLHGIRQKAGCAMEYENIIFRLDMLIPALPDRCSSEFLMPLLSGNGPSSYVCSQGCREFLPVQQLIARLDAISDSRPAGYELAVKGIFFELLFLILPQRQGSGDETAGSRFQGKMKLVLKEVENRYAEPLTVKEMADMCGYSASHFMKFFRRQMGKRMTDRNGRRVRRIVRFDDAVQMKDCFYHLLHLVFVCAAVACHGLLDLERRIFVYGNSAFYRRHNGNAASLCSRNGSFGIIVEKKLFYGNGVWLKLLQQILYAIIHFADPAGKGLLLFCRNRAIFN